MSWKKRAFANFKLYAVTDLQREDPAIFRKVEAAYRGGADIVQLRSKNLTDAELYRIGTKMRKLAARFRKLFFVNDRPDLALAVGADGVHVGQDDLPVSRVRKILGKDFFIGLSTHSLRQALEAAKQEVDYIGVGPVFKTPTKPKYSPIGLDLVRKLNPLTLPLSPQAGRGNVACFPSPPRGGEGGGEGVAIKVPVVFIGGINHQNIGSVLDAGATRAAVVRAIFDAPDPFRAAQTLKRAIETYAR